MLCISKDERNRQPSPRELAMADYIFYRFFDVNSCTLSEQLPEKIAGVEGQQYIRFHQCIKLHF